MPQPLNVAKIAVSSATYHIDRPYDYKIPAAFAGQIAAGVRVAVPFGRGNKKSEGLVLSVTSDGGARELKSIDAVLDEEPVLDTGQLKLALWMSDRFFCTVFEAAKAMLPAAMWFKDGVRRLGDKTVTTAVLAIPAEEALQLAAQKKRRAPQQAYILEVLSQFGEMFVRELLYFTGASRGSLNSLRSGGAVLLEQQEVLRRPKITAADAFGPVELNGEQQASFDGLSALLKKDGPEAALLYGITGSGKTAVYIRLIEETLKKGKGALVLVPEIALTPQLIGIFAAHFGDEGIAVVHSGLGLGERYDEWKRIRSGQVQVVVGTRSAVFSPVKSLGLLIIDEEQEHTYKSENSPRYHAREVAKYRCVASNALLLLGSATPSVESMHSALSGKYKLFRIDGRYNERGLPRVLIADMKEELKSGCGGTVGTLLLDELRENIGRGEQSILLINRRGANTLVACGECGFTFNCPRCSVSVTYHSANRRLMCHYCGHSGPVRDSCPECGGRLKFIGAGTQRVEEELEALLPGVGVLRMDTDTVSPARGHEAYLTRFRREKIPILLGTQMIAKGLDIENVTLVGVLSADQSLYVNDYRAHERTFSLITQVVGRSGRGSKDGRAVIQTFTPSNEVIRLAAAQDYDGFYRRDIELRRLQGSPPFFDLIALTVSGVEEEAVLRGCVRLRSALEGYLGDRPDVRVLGPAAAAVARVNNRFRYRISLTCKSDRRVRDTVAHVVRSFFKDKACRGLHVHADADPYDT